MTADRDRCNGEDKTGYGLEWLNVEWGQGGLKEDIKMLS